MTRTFNPNLLKLPIFNTLDIAIPILTPLVNFDQLVSVIAGIPRGTIDNIVNSVNQINNFLTTPAPTRVISSKMNRQGFISFISNLADAFDNNGEHVERVYNNYTPNSSSIYRLGNTVSCE